MKNERARQPGADLLRVIAMALVVVIHAASYSGAFPEQVTVTGRWLALLYVQRLSHICVPLFLLLTGYLARSREPDRPYYRGLVRLALSYLAVAVLCVAARVAAGTRYSFWEAVLVILNFTADEYGWYAEMYVGLFLLIPFLNRLWDALETKRRRGILLGTLALMTLLPETIKSFWIAGFTPNIVPDWWELLYPLTYYYIGAWIREYRLKVRPLPCGAVLFAITLVPWGAAALYSLDGNYGWFVLNSFQDLFTAGAAVALFLLLYDLPAIPKVPAGALAALSRASFEYYLLSYLSDQLVWGSLTVSPVLKLALALVLPILPALGLRWASGWAAKRLQKERLKT